MDSPFGHQDGLVYYVRAQLNLRHVISRDAGEEISTLFGLVEKDLDQTGVTMGLHRYTCVLFWLVFRCDVQGRRHMHSCES
jgi:hypothetical protein